MADIYPVHTPQTLNLTNIVGTPLQFKLVPRSATGAVLDLTGYTVESFKAIPQAANNALINSVDGGSISVGNSVVAADATGITILCTPAQVKTARDLAFGMPLQWALAVIDDDTDDTHLIAGYGLLTFTGTVFKA